MLVENSPHRVVKREHEVVQAVGPGVLPPLDCALREVVLLLRAPHRLRLLVVVPVQARRAPRAAALVHDRVVLLESDVAPPLDAHPSEPHRLVRGLQVVEREHDAVRDLRFAHAREPVVEHELAREEDDGLDERQAVPGLPDDGRHVVEVGDRAHGEDGGEQAEHQDQARHEHPRHLPAVPRHVLLHLLAQLLLQPLVQVHRRVLPIARRCQ
mmetsp:Transcript_2167/g.5099  ORF Transcript_2167/g.5099 Transcript_2167/m.5099 type:complete len:212 (-) Transcript_2167:408-1043(-)